jgi:hypothetical protein
MILPNKDGFFRPKNIEQLKELVSQKVLSNRIILSVKPIMELIERVEALEAKLIKGKK